MKKNVDLESFLSRVNVFYETKKHDLQVSVQYISNTSCTLEIRNMRKLQTKQKGNLYAK